MNEINKIISINRISDLHSPLCVSEMGRVCNGSQKLIVVRLDVLPMMRNVKIFKPRPRPMVIFSTNQFCFWKYTSEAISQFCSNAPDFVINKETMECRSLNAVLIQHTSQYAPRWKLQWVACFTQVMWSCHINCRTKLLPPFSSPHLTHTILIGLFKRTLLSIGAFKVSSLYPSKEGVDEHRVMIRLSVL